MGAFLVFTLAAPIAAFGGLAVGERRYGSERPGRSLVLGLLSAALGIDRADEEGHQRLEHGLGLAIRLDRPGALFDDYHTAQVPAARRGKRWATRRAELAEPSLETILSVREYRSDVCVRPAVWTRAEAPIALEQLASALTRPRYRLCFGRRACPLGRPPAARLVEATSIVEALDAYDAAEAAATEAAAPSQVVAEQPLGRTTLVSDVEAKSFLGPRTTATRIVTRRDVVLSRRRWQFGLRQELVAFLDPRPETAS